MPRSARVISRKGKGWSLPVQGCTWTGSVTDMGISHSSSTRTILPLGSGISLPAECSSFSPAECFILSAASLTFWSVSLKRIVRPWLLCSSVSAPFCPWQCCHRHPIPPHPAFIWSLPCVCIWHEGVQCATLARGLLRLSAVMVFVAKLRATRTWIRAVFSPLHFENECFKYWDILLPYWGEKKVLSITWKSFPLLRDNFGVISWRVKLNKWQGRHSLIKLHFTVGLKYGNSKKSCLSFNSKWLWNILLLLRNDKSPSKMTILLLWMWTGRRSIHFLAGMSMMKYKD